MAVTLEHFRENLVRSGLFIAAELAAFEQGLPPEKWPKDVKSLARELVQARKLTKYQAAAVYQGKTSRLVLGEYVILDKIAARGMGQVFKAEHRRMKRLAEITDADRVMGTVDYMSPEQAEDTRAAGHRSHVYSPGVKQASDGADVGCRYTPELARLCKKAVDLRKQGAISF